VITSSGSSATAATQAGLIGLSPPHMPNHPAMESLSILQKSKIYKAPR
jgi:hypothetical protein